VGGWDELVMPQMSADAPFAAAAASALASAGIVTSVTASGRCPYIPLPSTWDEYLRKLEGSSRYLVVRGVRELEKWAGKDGWRIHRAETRAELDTGRTILRSLHGERWEERGERGVFASPRFSRFHDEVMPKLLAGEDGTRLDLVWLSVKGEPVAALYNIVYGKKVYFYQSGRKIDVPKGFKPGIAIHALAIQRAIDTGLREYDFLNGASQYKQKLALASRGLVTLRAAGSGLRARATLAACALAENAAAYVRRRRRAETSPNIARAASDGEG
jgi:hypothetical protein